MASLKDIKLKVQSYKKTGTVTHAMEAVSAVKMRKTQQRALSARSFAAAALSVLERLSASGHMHRAAPLLPGAQDGERVRKPCYVVITSDKGLAGSLNSGVIRAVEAEIAKRGVERGDIMIIAAGRRGAEYFASRGYNVRARFENVSDNVSENDLREITDTLFSEHAAGNIYSCFVAYTNFVSTFEQQPVVRQVLPIIPEMMEEMVKGIVPAKGKYAGVAAGEKTRPPVYTIEPSPEEVLAVLMPKLLNIAVFHAMLEAKASEHSARMVAMKSATDKAKEMAASLTLVFNKVRQAAITREVSEITSGIEAMK